MFKLSGWTADITVPYRAQAVICVAPHTSNWDFIIGLFAYRSLGRKASFLMKDFWFFFPLKYLLHALGGIPVKRSTNNDLTSLIVEDFRKTPRLNLAITPEGTRKPVDRWKTGFLRIAYKAGVPVQLGILDYPQKKVLIKDEFSPTGNIEADLLEIRKYYKTYEKVGRHPDNFIP